MLCLVGALLPIAHGYEFKDDKLPSPKQLHVLFTFYVYSNDNINFHNSAQLIYDKLQLVSEGSSRISDSPSSFQLTFIGYDQFRNAIDRDSFCCSERDVTYEIDGCKKKDSIVFRLQPDTEAYKLTLSPLSSTVIFDLPKSGVYQLVVSNCGKSTDAKFSGEVKVKSPHGYISGLDYPKLNFYFGLTLAYFILILVWLIILRSRRSQQLQRMHYCILGLMVLGCGESGFRHSYFYDWNSEGVQRRSLFIIAILFTVVKRVFSHILVLVASLGWCITKRSLEKSTMMWVKFLAISSLMFDMVYQLTISLSLPVTLSTKMAVFCLIPGAAVNAAVFFWIFTSLDNLIQSLKEHHQPRKLGMLQSLWKALICGMILGTTTMVYQAVSSRDSIVYRWRTNWMLSDAIGQIVFFCVLLCMVYYWVPHESLNISYSYQMAQHGDVEPAIISKGSPEAWKLEQEEAEEFARISRYSSNF